jgi:DNA-binding transcriptional LysR family regulator
LNRRGTPSSIDDLNQHDCLIGTTTTWRFGISGNEHHMTPVARWRCNSGTAVAHAASAGLGICQLPAFYVRDLITGGDLVEVLGSYEPDEDPLWLVYPQRRHFLPKVRIMTEALLAGFAEVLA